MSWNDYPCRVTSKYFAVRARNRAVKVWERIYGPIPKGKWLLHHCDDRQCYELEHLWLGTAQQNTDDMISKGRAYHPSGEDFNKSKLNWEKVHAIRAEYVPYRMGVIRLAKKYGVSPSAIRSVITNQTWRS